MDITDYINKNNFSMDDYYVYLCRVGVEIMSNSVDPNHDKSHVQRILEELEKFVKSERKISKSIDFEILIPAICWHDVWKSKRKQTTNIFKLLAEQQYDGYGSYILLRKHLKDIGYAIPKSNNIEKLVFYHSGYSWLPPLRLMVKRHLRSSVELKLLKDLDMLDGFGINRTRRLAHKYIQKGKTDPLMFRVAYFWVTRQIDNIDSYIFNFEYFKKEAKRKSEETIEEMVDIFNRLLENKEYYFDTSSAKYKYIRDFKPSKKDLAIIERYG